MKIEAEGIFDVVFYDSPIPYTGEGFFEVHNGVLTDFGFSMVGFTWDESDAVFSAPPDQFHFQFSDEQGFGLLAWDFHQGLFGMTLHAGEYFLVGTSESVDATGIFSYLDRPMPVHEAGLLLVFTLLVTAIIGRATDKGSVT